MVFEEAVVTHGIEATCASPNGIEGKCASPRWRPNPEIDWHRDRYPRDMINPAGRNHVNRQRSPSSNAIISPLKSCVNICTFLTPSSRHQGDKFPRRHFLEHSSYSLSSACLSPRSFCSPLFSFAES